MALYEQAVEQFGESAQILMAVEEMSELQKALLKYLRFKDHEQGDEAEILAALDRMSMPQDMQIQVCDLLSSCYLRWGTAAFAIGLGLGLSLMQDCSGRRLRI